MNICSFGFWCTTFLCACMWLGKVHASTTDISDAVSSNATTGITNAVLLTTGIDGSKKPRAPLNTFSLDKKIFVHITLGDLPEKQPKDLTVIWYNCNRQMAITSIAVKPAPNPNYVWSAIDANKIGSGIGSVDVFKDTGELFSRSVFQVKNERGNIINCEGLEVSPQLPQKNQLSGRVISIPADATFSFMGYRMTDITSGGHEQLREIIRQLRTNSALINSIDIVGHTDNIGSTRANNTLSKQRAKTIANIFIANGFGAIRAIGVGASQPAVYCGAGNNKPTPQLIACNAPNRRVDVQINYLETSKPHQFIR